METFLIRVGLVAALLSLHPRAGEAQETLDAVRDLYSSAAYEDALTVLDRLSTTAGPAADRFPINKYRAFCYLALGRTTEAEHVIENLISDNPLYHPSDSEASPRLRSAFSAVRQRMLPSIVQQKYAAAKLAFDYKNYEAAEAGFAEIVNALADPDLGAAGNRPPLSDIGTLALGFRDLSAQAVARTAAAAAAAAEAADAAAAAEAAALAEAARVREAAAALPAPPRIFSLSDAGVSAPVIIRQDFPNYPLQFGPMTNGSLDILIDETGMVEEAVMRTSANARYDQLALAATKNWKFKPATLDGKPVKFRKIISVSLKTAGE